MMQGFDKMIKAMTGFDMASIKEKAEEMKAQAEGFISAVWTRFEGVEARMADHDYALAEIRAHLNIATPDTQAQHDANMAALAETSKPALLPASSDATG